MNAKKKDEVKELIGLIKESFGPKKKDDTPKTPSAENEDMIKSIASISDFFVEYEKYIGKFIGSFIAGKPFSNLSSLTGYASSMAKGGSLKKAITEMSTNIQAIYDLLEKNVKPSKSKDKKDSAESKSMPEATEAGKATVEIVITGKGDASELKPLFNFIRQQMTADNKTIEDVKLRFTSLAEVFNTIRDIINALPNPIHMALASMSIDMLADQMMPKIVEIITSMDALQIDTASIQAKYIGASQSMLSLAEICYLICAIGIVSDGVKQMADTITSTIPKVNEVITSLGTLVVPDSLIDTLKRTENVFSTMPSLFGSIIIAGILAIPTMIFTPLVGIALAEIIWVFGMLSNMETSLANVQKITPAIGGMIDALLPIGFLFLSIVIAGALAIPAMLAAPLVVAALFVIKGIFGLISMSPETQPRAQMKTQISAKSIGISILCIVGSLLIASMAGDFLDFGAIMKFAGILIGFIAILAFAGMLLLGLFALLNKKVSIGAAVKGMAGLGGGNTVIDAFAQLIFKITLTLLLGGLVFTLFPQLIPGVILFGAVLALFIILISVPFLFFRMISGVVAKSLHKFTQLVILSALLLVLGGWLLKEHWDIILLGLGFGVILGLFMWSLLTAIKRGTKGAGKAFAKLMPVMMLIGLCAAILILGPWLIKKAFDITGWESMALAYTQIFLFAGEMSLFLLAIVGIAKLASKGQSSLLKGMLAIGIAELLLLGLAAVGMAIAKAIKISLEPFSAGGVATAASIDMAFTAMLAWAGGMGLLLVAIGLAAVGVGSLVSGPQALLFLAGVAVIGTLNALAYQMGQAGIQIATAVLLTEQIKDPKKAAENLAAIISLPFDALTKVIDKLGDKAKDMLTPGLFTDSPFMNLIKCVGEMGKAISKVAEGVKEYAEMRIPTYNAAGTKVIGTRELSDNDFTRAGKNVQTIITTVMYAVGDMIEGRNGAPKIPKEYLEEGLFSDSPFMQLMKCVEKMGQAIGPIAQGVSQFASMQIPTKWDKDGKPTEFANISSNGKEFEQAAKNIADVITTIFIAIADCAQRPDVKPFIAEDFFGSDSDASRMFNAVGAMGNAIGGIAEGVFMFAEGKVPIYDKNGKCIGYHEFDTSTPKITAAAQSIGTVISTIISEVGKAMTNIPGMVKSQQQEFEENAEVMGKTAAAGLVFGPLGALGMGAYEGIKACYGETPAESMAAVMQGMSGIGDFLRSIVTLVKDIYGDAAKGLVDSKGKSKTFEEAMAELMGTEEEPGVIVKITNFAGDIIEQIASLSARQVRYWDNGEWYTLGGEFEGKTGLLDFIGEPEYQQGIDAIKKSFDDAKDIIQHYQEVFGQDTYSNVPNNIESQLLAINSVTDAAAAIISKIAAASATQLTYTGEGFGTKVAEFFGAGSDEQTGIWAFTKKDEWKTALSGIEKAYDTAEEIVGYANNLVSKVGVGSVGNYQKIFGMYNKDDGSQGLYSNSNISIATRYLPSSIIYNIAYTARNIPEKIYKDMAELIKVYTSIVDVISAAHKSVSFIDKYTKVFDYQKLGFFIANDTVKIFKLSPLSLMFNVLPRYLSTTICDTGEYLLSGRDQSKYIPEINKFFLQTIILTRTGTVLFRALNKLQNENLVYLGKTKNNSPWQTLEKTFESIDKFQQKTAKIDPNTIKKINTITNLATAISAMGEKFGNIDKLTQVLATTLNKTLEKLCGELRKSEKTINTAEQIQVQRQKAINEAIAKINEIMGKDLTVLVRQERPEDKTT